MDVERVWDEFYRSLNSHLPNNSLEHSASGAGPVILRPYQAMIHLREPKKAREGTIPGRSLA